jgi:hypothetical protein
MASKGINTDLDFSAPTSSTPAVGASKLLKIITASRAAVSNASGDLAASATTATEIGYVSGVTSAIQTQINTLSASVAATFPVADTQTLVKGSADATKLLRFEVDGFTTGTTRVLTPPNADIVIAGSAAALTSGRVPNATTGGLLTNSNIFINGNNVGIGVSPNYPLEITVASVAGSPVFATRLNYTSNVTTSGASFAIANDVAANISVSAGQTDSGYKRAARTEIYCGSGHAGTSALLEGYVVSAYIDATAPATALVTTIRGINANVRTDKAGTTISTAQAVYANSSGSAGTVTNAYDFYGANASGKNYLAGFLSVGVDANTAQFQVNTGSSSRVAAIIKGAASQSANLLELQSSAAAVLASVSAAGLGTFAGLSITDATNIAFSATTGSKIGTATTQKLAFHNSTPTIQRAGAAQNAVATTAATNIAPYGFTTQAQADAIITLTNEIRAALVEKGLIKGSA